MHELSKQFWASTKDSFGVFKEHALDVAIVASAAEPPENGRLRAVYQQSELKKMAQLPLAMLYAFIALVCVVTFAAVYYPKMYGPLLLEKARAKLIEYHVAEKASVAKVTVVEYSSKAYEKAYESAVASGATAKGAELLEVGKTHASVAVAKVMEQPVVQTAAEKASEAAALARQKVADELHKLRTGQADTPQRVANGTV